MPLDSPGFTCPYGRDVPACQLLVKLRMPQTVEAADLLYSVVCRVPGFAQLNHTPFDLCCFKHIIHAVGPRWIDGKHNEPELLYNAYYSSLELAVEHQCHSIGFPLISSGIFGYPVDAAWKRALTACGDYLDKHQDVSLDIVFAAINDETIKAGRKALANGCAARYKIAERSDWKALDMPTQYDAFVLRRTFTSQQMAALHRGNIPQQMEDK
jgi:Predicted phosphatase homologous to the C-terminal domain of histone macroH2A1